MVLLRILLTMKITELDYRRDWVCNSGFLWIVQEMRYRNPQVVSLVRLFLVGPRPSFFFLLYYWLLGQNKQNNMCMMAPRDRINPIRFVMFLLLPVVIMSSPRTFPSDRPKSSFRMTFHPAIWAVSISGGFLAFHVVMTFFFVIRSLASPVAPLLCRRRSFAVIALLI